MCADACEAVGVEVPELPAELQSTLSSFLPAAASASNPIDMLATASAEDYGRAIRALIDADSCDAILAIFVPPLVTDATDVAVALREVAEEQRGVPIAAVFMSSKGPPSELGSGEAHVPGYEYPESAARALALASAYGRWRSTPARELSAPSGTRPEQAAAVISRELARSAEWMSPTAVIELLDCYGLPLVPTRIVSDAAGAIAAAAEFGSPVALKAIASGVVHKTDAGGVRLGREGAEAVGDAAAGIEAALTRAGHRLEGLIVQPMAPEGVELIVGVVNDRSFGPVLACGAGGTTAELIKDVAVRITPVSDVDAHEMLRSLRTFPLLEGYRGAPPCDLGAIEDVLLRVSALVEAHSEIAELDLNPVVASPQGALVLDARVRIEPAPPVPPMSSLMREE
jgi:acyl-CoA synthetase (NDP forming)